MRRSGVALGYRLLVAPVLGWGGSYRASAIAGGHSPALMQNALRCGIAALILTVLLGPLRARLPRGRLALWAALSGLLMVTIYFEGFAEGVIRAGAGNASVLASTSPLFVLVFARLFLGERMPWAGALGLVCGFVGVVLMVWSQLGGGHGDSLALGMAVALLAGASWAAGTLLVKWLADREPDLDVTGLTTAQYLVGGGLLVVLAFAIDGTGGTDWSSGELWGAIAFLAVGASVIATLAFFAALKRLPATVVSSSQILVPVVAVLIEAVRGNAPTAVVLAGMVLAVGGVALVILAPLLAERSEAAAPAG
jgi:drug/metabolite transporter (DMT)-like permease